MIVVSTYFSLCGSSPLFDDIDVISAFIGLDFNQA